MTTFIKAVDDQTNLTGWKQRQVVVGLVARNDLRLRAASLGSQPLDEVDAKRWRAQMGEVCEDAMKAAGSDAAATVGTALHAFTEALDKGEKPHIPDDLVGHMKNYRAATSGFKVAHIERLLVCDEFKTAGTADRIWEIDGRLVIGDIKTGNVDYPSAVQSFAMQLGLYAHSMIYDPATAARSPLDGIRLDWGLVAALDAKTGDCRLLEVDIARGWEAVQLAAQVREWRRSKGLTKPFKAAPQDALLPASGAPGLAPVGARNNLLPDPAGPRLEAVAALRTARSVPELTATAERIKASGLWDQGLNNAASQRWGELTGTPPF
ncbi:MAG: PD-(D/E)XK nuclease family protein [Propionibacteriaceae bacterium]|nr:PD-(D/E)XK nuclease family protein [Propionibacteriaceae bacterium]